MDISFESIDVGTTSDIRIACSDFIDELLHTAKTLISRDYAELFFYKMPQNELPLSKLKMLESRATSMISHRPQSTEMFPVLMLDAHSKVEVIEWSTIKQFKYRYAVTQIQNFIDLWQLTPSTKFAMVTYEFFKVIRHIGYRCYVDAYFSKPTQMCPNPLAVAKVHFHIHVPYLMPKHYPIMVTYRFEGYKTVYYALGSRRLQSFSFQRFFIDEILRSKLLFYTQVFNCFYSKANKKEGGNGNGDDDDDDDGDDDKDSNVDLIDVNL